MAVERLRGAKTQVAASTDAESEFGEFGILLNGEWIKTGDAIEVRSPYDDSLVAVAHRAGPDEVEKAIALATESFDTTRHMPSWQREEILMKVSEGIKARREELGRVISLEAGKPLKQAIGEADRAVFTFKIAAEESKRIYGEIVPLDWIPGVENRVAHIHRVPRGPVAGIAPFNYPLNLVAHKVAPAMAAGNPIVLRPASQTPVSALMLGEIVLEAGWPEAAIAVIPTKTSDAAPLVEDNRIKKLTFTGSPAVGWMLKSKAGMKPVTLELGGNAGTIVNEDADVEAAAKRIAWGGFQYAGQSCISVQRVYVHENIWDEFIKFFVPAVKALKFGNPLDPDTDVGPVIDSGAAERIEEWVNEAVAAGAEILVGGKRDGNLFEPTALTSVNEDMNVACQEVFGPVLSLFPFTDVMDAIDRVGDSEFGLQAGLFTNDWRTIQAAFDRIEVGGLMVNDVSTFRVDHMPYGGAKASGFGREGLRYAIEEMTEMKLLTLNNGY